MKVSRLHSSCQRLTAHVDRGLVKDGWDQPGQVMTLIDCHPVPTWRLSPNPAALLPG